MANSHMWLVATVLDTAALGRIATVSANVTNGEEDWTKEHVSFLKKIAYLNFETKICHVVVGSASVSPNEGAGV